MELEVVEEDTWAWVGPAVEMCRNAVEWELEKGE